MSISFKEKDRANFSVDTILFQGLLHEYDLKTIKDKIQQQRKYISLIYYLNISISILITIISALRVSYVQSMRVSHQLNYLIEFVKLTSKNLVEIQEIPKKFSENLHFQEGQIFLETMVIFLRIIQFLRSNLEDLEKGAKQQRLYDAFVLFRNLRNYHIAGIIANNIGNLHLSEGDQDLARYFYQLSLGYALKQCRLRSLDQVFCAFEKNFEPKISKK